MNKQQRIAIELANLKYLQNGKDEIFELFCAVSDEFDGSEYQQGKKDGLRSALALLGMSDMSDFNRGGVLSRDNYGNSNQHPATSAEKE